MWFLFGLIVGIAATLVAGWFVWKNNKVKWNNTVDAVDNYINESNVSEEIKAKLNAILKKQ